MTVRCGFASGRALGTDDRDAQMTGSLAKFSDEALVAGTEESRRAAREDLLRQRRRHLAEGSNWPRLEFADLRFERYYVEHARTGERYRVYRGEIMSATYSPVVAWFVGTDGGPMFLEPAR